MPYLLLLIGCIGLIFSSIGLHIPYIQQFDHSTVEWISLHRSSFLNDFSVGLSYIGGLPATLFICGCWCLYLFWQRKIANILFIGFGISGSVIIGWSLKYLIDRPRPDAMYQMVKTYGASFPSAHSLYAAVLASLVLFVFYKHAQAKLIHTLAYLWCLSMGFSRVYLGAHFPTDVIAGWSIGFIWIALLWLMMSRSLLSKTN
ncbi:phosphatase PAP2 family protein [Acinetobacter sp. ANC 4648]|uniref:phosphatase PAP2 family protein n=1 Tax=Acinetobacter sp. ANC 4648 TaxID=1977875 RepID=UPI001D1707E1|nr:phosphatase PAP2 family protein [Acinetobacter sp. ANC 4648]